MKKSGIFILTALSMLSIMAAMNVLKTNRAPAGETAGNLKPASIDSFKAQVKESKGTVLLINLWASWCEPCKVEFPALLQLKKKYEAKGLDLILVSLDHEDQRLAAQEFLNSQKVTFASLFKGPEKMGFLQPIFPQWPGAIPASFLINKDLKVLESWIGETTLPQFEAKILRHLPKP